MNTHEMAAFEAARYSSFTGRPSASSGGRMLNACRIDAHSTNMDASANGRPGHTLRSAHAVRDARPRE